MKQKLHTFLSNSVYYKYFLISLNMSDSIDLPQVPPGRIYVNQKWKNTDIFSLLSRRVHPEILGAMDFVDFYPVNDFAVIYVTEADLLSDLYKRNLAKLKKANFDRNAVIVEKTQISTQYFESIQKFVVMELELGLIPVTGVNECCQVLVTLIRMGSEDKNSPFMYKRRAPPIDTYLLRTLATVPSLGETKAQALLLNFKSLLNICNASLEDLTKVVGANRAQQVYNFFHMC